MSFVNFSNHRSATWNDRQRLAAEKWGSIIDIPFPNISAASDEAEIKRIAERCVERILSCDPAAVMCQGEFTLVYAVISELKKRGVTVVSACSNRRATETILDDGTTQKQSIFEFIRFREYK